MTHCDLIRTLDLVRLSRPTCFCSRCCFINSKRKSRRLLEPNLSRTRASMLALHKEDMASRQPGGQLSRIKDTKSDTALSLQNLLQTKTCYIKDTKEENVAIYKNKNLCATDCRLIKDTNDVTSSTVISYFYHHLHLK